jgi:DNA-binding transcriptional LysR family regulator
MEIHQLKTFVTVAREGSITRASERLYLSQPAVSAHIKAIEDELAIALFDRTPRGMILTCDGHSLLSKAERTLQAHRDLLEEATRIKGKVTGRLRLGAGSNSTGEVVGRLLTQLSDRCPDVEVALQHCRSCDILSGIRSGTLDAGFYNEAGEPDDDLTTIEVSRFAIYLAAPPGFFTSTESLDWQALGELPWIYPTCSTCCGAAAENLFRMHNFRPRRIISIDRESVTRTLLAGGVGVGLLHAETAKEAQLSGEVDIVCEAQKSVRVLFAYLKERANNPIMAAIASILNAGLMPPAPLQQEKPANARNGLAHNMPFSATRV